VKLTPGDKEELRVEPEKDNLDTEGFHPPTKPSKRRKTAKSKSTTSTKTTRTQDPHDPSDDRPLI